MRSIHLKVKEVAEQRNLSDLQLAHLSHVDVRVIRKMWTGQRVGEVLLNQLLRVADALEMDVRELIEDRRE